MTVEKIISEKEVQVIIAKDVTVTVVRTMIADVVGPNKVVAACDTRGSSCIFKKKEKESQSKKK